MRFFKLTHPNYDSDRAESSRNPVSSTASHRLPGIKCTECGPWSSSERLRVAVPADDAEFLGVRFLGVDEWKTRALLGPLRSVSLRKRSRLVLKWDHLKAPVPRPFKRNVCIPFWERFG